MFWKEKYPNYYLIGMDQSDCDKKKKKNGLFFLEKDVNSVESHEWNQKTIAFGSTHDWLETIPSSNPPPIAATPI